MTYRPQSELDLQQLSTSLEKVKRALTLQHPPLGWLRTIRTALGMRTGQLGVRLGLSQPSVVRAEEREITGAITLSTLRRFASELDCDLVYFLVPRTSLQMSVEKQAESVARGNAAAMAQSLGIQWQVVPSPAVVQLIDQEKDRLVAERPARLWDPNTANT
jgi:predicted DNA-binding mobile mystery protein A